MVLKKSDILLGINDPRLIMINALGGEIYLRPLSSFEVNKVVGIESEGYGSFEAVTKGTKDPDANAKLNLKKMNDATAKAQYEAIFLSINNDQNEEWSMDEIKSLRKDAVDELYDKIMNISGAETTESDVKNFPANE